MGIWIKFDMLFYQNQLLRLVFAMECVASGSNLPSPGEVINMYKQYNIGRMRLYDPNLDALQALRGTNIELMLGIPDKELKRIASSQDYANT